MKSLKRSFIKNEVKFGLILFVLTIVLLFYFYGRNNILASLSLGLTWVGSSLIFDFLLRKKSGKSIFVQAFSSWQDLLKITAVSVFSAFILDVFGLYLTRLWYYPYIPNTIYFILSPFLYLFYTLVLFVIYEFLKSQGNKYVKAGRTSNAIKTLYPRIMKILFAVGVSGLVACVTYGITNISRFSMPFYSVSVDSKIPVPLWFVLLIMPSIYLVFEYFCYLEGKETLLYSLLRRDFVPLFAIAISSFIGIMLMELLNAPFQVWIYANGPFNTMKFVNVPIWVWLMWPTQFLMFLSLFRLVLDQKKIDIW